MTEYKDKIDQMIINSPFEEPQRHWHFDKTREKHFIQEGRRSAGYTFFSDAKTHQDFGTFYDFPLVNKIRPRVKKWREQGYPGATSVTKSLLNFWNKEQAEGRTEEFFFCQKESIETLIWLKEAHSSERVGIDIPKDGGDFERLCAKMATGTGKTYVMGMLIAWHILNKLSHPQDTRFSKNILIVCPNLTVKKRLSVLKPEDEDNYYEKKKIVPQSLLTDLSQGKILIVNWQSLQWEKEDAIRKRRSVDKRGAKSDEAYIREVLGDMSTSHNILVINDEAHHAWRYQSDEDIGKGKDEKDEKERATVWIQSLDRIHRKRGILTCIDFSATPLSSSQQGNVFPWIVSDFGLQDAIEAGITKTPVFAINDDQTSDDKRSKLYHIYNDDFVKTNLNSQLSSTPIPQLIENGYALLSKSWEDTFKQWKKATTLIPPVMISVVNTKNTADRINDFFDKGKVSISKHLCKDQKVVIHSDIDPPIERKTSKRENLEEKREIVGTVGQRGKPGEQITHIISVAMLSEGWNCQTVTHIMGLRAFSSQLLCEQVIGRGLRRTSYEKNDEGRFDPEYVKILGIPFALLPQEESGKGRPRQVNPKWEIFPDPAKEKYKITWPNIERIDFDLKPILKVDWHKVDPLKVSDVRTIAELAPEVNGQPNYDKIKIIDLKGSLGQKGIRLQTLIFEKARSVYERIHLDWKNKVNPAFALCQIFGIVEKFLKSDKLKIKPRSFNEDKEKRLVTIMIAMEQIVEKIFSAIKHQNKENLKADYKDQKYLSTKEAPSWWTGKKTYIFNKTHINKCVFDSDYELRHAQELDKNKYVEAWVKNDHLGFEVPYVHTGVIKNYIPDFIVRLVDQSYMVLEVKGVKKIKDESKWAYMEHWIEAVNQDEGNGRWYFKTSFDPTGQSVHEIIDHIINVNQKSLEAEKEQIRKEKMDKEEESL